MKKILILGAGMVAQPIIRYLLNQGFQVTVASNTPDRAEKMIAGNIRGINVNWSVDDGKSLERMISEADIVVSLLPYLFHLQVAGKVLKLKKNMVTTSYVKPEMEALDSLAKEAGIIFLNEMGLDPGIDHMTAMRIIDHIHHRGGKVEEFYSLCGALCAPEAADNPFMYKFTWSPKGVVLAGNNDARFLKNGKVVDLPTANLFRNPNKINFPGIGLLDVYPNRDSISYIGIYGIPEIKTMYRGTFRFPGWCEAFDAMKKIGLTTVDKFDMSGLTYADMLAKLCGLTDTHNLKQQIANVLGVAIDSVAVAAIQWLGLLDSKPMNRGIDSAYEVVSDLMIDKMMLPDNERDMVIMQHTFLAAYPDGKKEVIRSRMLDFGSPQTDTSIARTVALPAAVAVKMILENKIQVKGVFRPVIPEIYSPVLNELEAMNIKMTEEYGLPESENI
ncbi:MAG: saccharopine dehydrogenase NADP-binding domain-containing protein [Bacteroidia bacterium]|nr:saccharopine dehydrogenase NADP-binding domain-containing protein [Bacteroidia bacterium]